MENKVIYLKFDELYLKGNNIDSFKDRLVTNTKKALYGFNFELKINYDSLLLQNLEQDKINLIISIVTRIPGFSHCAIAYIIEHNLDKLYQLAFNETKVYDTFKIEVKRSYKNYQYNSDELKRMVASYILINNNKIKVNIHNPAIKLNIDVKNKNFIVYTNKISCTKGLPVGSSGKALMLLSGGIDSPVASHLLLTRGMHVDFLVFVTPPFTENALVDKIKNLVKLITFNYRIESPKIYLCNYTNIQNELTHISKESYRITLLRRSFLRIANHIAKQLKYDCIATGDALGQVASQTIESISVIDEASELLVLRPLIAQNKESIINIAKQINTYKESIVPLCDTCSLFAPKNPVTRPKLAIAKELEDKLDLLLGLEKNVMNFIEVISYDKKQ